MICGACGQPGHNNMSKKCPSQIIKESISNMYKFTHTGTYYLKSLLYIQELYPNRICLSDTEIRWNAETKTLSNLTKAFAEKDKCSLDFIYFRVNISGYGESHANYILLHTRRGIFWRYEPHGNRKSNPYFDKQLFDFANGHSYVYLSPTVSCPQVGIQSAALDTLGLCQTSVIYSLLNNLDPVKYNYKKAIANPASASRELMSLAVVLLTHIYIKTPDRSKFLILNYNNLNIFQQSVLNYDLVI